MELRDNGDAETWGDAATGGRRTAVGASDERPPAADLTPAERVERVATLIERDSAQTSQVVGELLTIVTEHQGAPRVAAGEALDAIGRQDPRAFEVWTDALAAVATDADDEVAFFGLRALAQLAAVRPQAATKGRAAALQNLSAPSADLRRAALSIVAEIGPDDPVAVQRADRPLSAALDDDDAGVRTGAAIAAGRLLASSPSRFPRTATTLIDALDDEDDAVRKYAHLALANFANEHPSNVPRKERAIEALANVSDDDLDLRRGAIGEALTALVSNTFAEGTAD